MKSISVEILLLILSSIVVMSYIFSILSRYIKVPSVLLLLAAGIVLKLVANQQGWNIVLPGKLVEFLGVTGLVMIILEAGLDLKLSSDKKTVIGNSFFAALLIFVLSLAAIAAGLFYWLDEPLIKCVVYGIPLSIMSSSIVIPSLHALSPAKKEFLVYEASFSDIIGILFFNFMVAEETLSFISVSNLFISILVSVLLSLLFSLLLLVILAKSKLNIRFFLIFALLIFLYVSGKLMHLPSLIIILVFGMLMNNWNLVKVKKVQAIFPQPEVEKITQLLLDYFNLKSLDQLPSLSEIRDFDKINEELMFEPAGSANDSSTNMVNLASDFNGEFADEEDEVASSMATMILPGG